MSYKDKKIMFKNITQDYLDKHLKGCQYTINDTYRQKTIYVLNNEGTLILKSMLNKCDMAIIPMGIYSQTLPYESTLLY